MIGSPTISICPKSLKSQTNLSVLSALQFDSAQIQFTRSTKDARVSDFSCEYTHTQVTGASSKQAGGWTDEEDSIAKSNISLKC